MCRYIDADAIEYHEIFEGHEFVRVAYGDDIDNIPTADVVPTEFHDKCMEIEIQKRMNMVERKHGEWISHIEDDDCVECSVCGFATTCVSTEEMNTLRYCYYCGSYMRGEEDA